MKLTTRLSWFPGLLGTLLLALITSPAAGAAAQAASRQVKELEGLPAAEFSRLIRELSEEGGYFPSDNFTSNESSYLTVVDKLRQLEAVGGAYIGVGPEQNFTYIAKIRPRIAFIVDIRRQAMIQQLMYKAIFHLAPTRAQFLSLLLSKPLWRQKATAPGATINELLAFFSNTTADDRAYASNLAAIRRVIQEDFQFQLSETDLANLEYVYKSFRTDGLEIGFRMSSRRGGGNVFIASGFGGSGFGRFPSLGELFAQRDLHGDPGSFLASTADYDFVRGLHRKNLIIPVVGDFAGKKALAAVGDYLRENGYKVTAFYTSNVEMILFRNELFTAFVGNVRKLPINNQSLFIRAAFARYSHPAQAPGYGTYTLLQRISVFLRDFDEGRLNNYTDLLMTHYIAAEKP
jgi:hypothetical protein